MTTTTKEMPDSVHQSFVYMSRYLLSELAMFTSEVVLVPAPEPAFEGHKVRMCISQNPYWWSELYRTYERSKLDRAGFIGSLNRIINRTDDGRKYDRYAREKVKFFCLNGLYGEEPDPVMETFFSNQNHT